MTSDLRCPACAALVREGAPWCTQCYAALAYERTGAPAAVEAAPAVPAPAGPAPAGPAPAGPAPAGPAPAVPAPRSPDPVLPELHGTAPPVWPCTGCGTTVPLDLSACPSCGEPFLRAERPSLVLPGVGDLAALPRSRRLVLALLVVLLVLGVTTGLAAG